MGPIGGGGGGVARGSSSVHRRFQRGLARGLVLVLWAGSSHSPTSHSSLEGALSRSTDQIA